MNTYLSDAQQTATECTKVCQKNSGAAHERADFAFDVEGDIISFNCTNAHESYKEGLERAANEGKPAPKSFVIPELNTNIPGLTFSEPISSATAVKSFFLEQYLGSIYKYLLNISITIAIIMIMVGGFQYVIAAGGGDVSKGKKRITNAVTGLVLLLCVYLILTSVNPQLINLKEVELQNVQPVEMPEVDEGDVQLDSPKRLCHSIEACQTICNNRSTVPVESVELPKLKQTPGFINSGGAKGTADLQAALSKAGEIALKKNPNYTLDIIGSQSGYRSIKAQVDAGCASIAKDGGVSLKTGILAWPGGSNHGSGVAVDILLRESGKSITTTSSGAQKNARYQVPAQILSEIMHEAGFVRYKKEIWHFELKAGAGSSCRCSFPNCPFPPKC